MTRTLLAIAAAVWLPVCGATATNDLTARLEARIPELMKIGEVPGLSVALVEKGKVAWTRGFGTKKADASDPVTADTAFEAGSLSKPVFAYGVLKLVEQGKLDLDTPLSKYLPESYIANDDRLHQITARRVLSHTTGFPNWRPEGQPLVIHFTPGDRFSYSGEGFVYLQKVVEKITGQPLNDYMTAAVFDPLGMKSSSYVTAERLRAVRASGHGPDGKPGDLRKQESANAAASLITTAPDFARFMAAVMNGKGLAKESMRQMLSPQVQVDEACTNCTNRPPEKRSEILAWGLGWGLQRGRGGQSFWHWGDNWSFRCFTISSPQEKRGIVVFTNSNNGLSIIPEIVTLAMGSEQPAFAWIRYDRYDSPATVLFRAVRDKGAGALEAYRAARKAGGPALKENEVNRLGYDLLRGKRMAEAIEVFRMNTEDFPESANVWDSLAEAYMEAGNKPEAIRNYEKALKMDPANKNAEEQLRKLRE